MMATVPHLTACTRRKKYHADGFLLDRVYKCMIKPVWTYGIQLWGCAKPSHTQIIQRLQSKILRSITNAPWYVSNLTLHKDLHIPFVTMEISRFSSLYHHRLASHYVALVTALATLPPTVRRLKTRWPADLSTPRYNERFNLVPCITHSWVNGVSLLNDFSLLVKLL
jgi:hypothetical protein